MLPPQGLGVPSFAHFMKMGEKKTPELSQTYKHQHSVQLSSGRMAKVCVRVCVVCVHSVCEAC